MSPIMRLRAARAARAVWALPVLLVLALLGGCGGGTPQAPPGASPGEKLFDEQCAACHTLSAAGATGAVGPNLDESSLAIPAIERRIAGGGGGMPAFGGQLTQAQIAQIAAYIARSSRATR